MKYEQSKLYALRTKNEILTLCNIDEEFYSEAISRPYNTYIRIANGKKRLIEEPNEKLKLILQNLLLILQELDCPEYCQSGWKGLNNIKNAENHQCRLETVNFDISHFFPNTNAKYVEKFFREKFRITGEVLEILLTLTTYNGHLPTGAPTSTILAFLSHKSVFDRIYRKMKQNSIKMTVYVDDITLSSSKHIGNWVIKYCNNAVKSHCLWLKKAKIKRFGYKYSWITGVRINQAGKMLVPFHMDYAVVKMLRDKDVEKMSLEEVQKLLGKIGYIQQIIPNRFATTKQKARKRLKEVVKAIQSV